MNKFVYVVIKEDKLKAIYTNYKDAQILAEQINYIARKIPLNEVLNVA